MNNEFKRMSNGESTGAELRDLIWSALKDGARFNKVEFNNTNLDVGDWLEDLNPDEVVSFINDMTNTLPKSKVKDIKKKIVK